VTLFLLSIASFSPMALNFESADSEVLRPAHAVDGRSIPARLEPEPPNIFWDEAHSNGWSDANRDANTINRIIIHVTQGSYSGAISWFNNPDAGVAAHYVINNHDAPYSSNQNRPDGEITQMVLDEDIGYHDANANANSIGIEHSAYLDPDNGYQVEGGFSDYMYNESAMLVAWLTFIYNIPVDRHFIVGHSEDDNFGGTSSHQDPGPDWDWNLYLNLVEQYRGVYGMGEDINQVVEVTRDVTVHLGPHPSTTTGLVAHAGERYSILQQCICNGSDFVRIMFNGSESTWIPTDAVSQVPSATLVRVVLNDEYDWLNVRDSASVTGVDLGNVFHNQSFVMTNNGTWSEFWFEGEPTAFAHSAYLTEESWIAPPPDPVPGCTNETALNYDANATVDDGSCEYPPPEPEPVPGCTNETALNFVVNATLDDGSCEYPPPAPEPVLGCTNESALNYDGNATVDDGSCEFPPVDPAPEPAPEPEPEPEPENPPEEEVGDGVGGDTSPGEPDSAEDGAAGLVVGAVPMAVVGAILLLALFVMAAAFAMRD